MVHRDIKPDNVLLVDDHAIVADLGIAHLEGEDETRLTVTGNLVGTPRYLSPEGRDVSPATDLYSVGVVLFELLTGTLPFGGSSIAELLVQISTMPAPEIVGCDVPRALAAMVDSMQSRSPSDRPRDAGSAAAALAEAASMDAASMDAAAVAAARRGLSGVGSP